MNKGMIKYFMILLLGFSQAIAQEPLSLDEAIQKTLKHNFDINIADLAAQQAAQNNTLGNAGFSPNVFINSSATESKSNSHLDLANGSVQDNPNGKSVNFSPTVAVTWTLFDGGKMFLLKKQLNELDVIGEVQLKMQIQTMVSRTIQMYAQVLWQQKQLIAIDTSLALAKTRMDISDLKFQTGAGPKVDYLQARVDYNSRESDSLTQEANYTQAMDSLCVLMGETEDKKYRLIDSLELNTALTPIDKDRLADVNLSVEIFRRNAKVSELNAKIAKTYYLPNLLFNGGYGYSETKNATGFALYSRSYGPNGMLTLTMPLFEGGNVRRQAKVATLQSMRDELLYEKQNTVIGRAYRTAWKNYKVSVSAYKLESENIKYAKENLDVQIARFKVGIGTTLEVRQAENDYVTALETLYTAEYNLKVNETVVLELENQLLK
jgi:outer membrane protein TolC